MESLDYWRFHDELSVVHATILIVDRDPSDYADNLHEWKDYDQPTGFKPVFTALQNVIDSKVLAATIRHEARGFGSDPDEYPGTHETVIQDGEAQHCFVTKPDWTQTTIKVTDLKTWLASRGFRTRFFFVDDVEPEDFLDPNHPCYAPKLAAAVTAWTKFSKDEKVLGGKTPKQAMTKWLREKGLITPANGIS